MAGSIIRVERILTGNGRAVVDDHAPRRAGRDRRAQVWKRGDADLRLWPDDGPRRQGGHQGRAVLRLFVLESPALCKRLKLPFRTDAW